jgi:hypothetical protein
MDSHAVVSQKAHVSCAEEFASQKQHPEKMPELALVLNLNWLGHTVCR